MPIDYDARKQKWARILSEFPPVLRDNVALRNVEAVAALPANARETLAQAIQQGLKRIPAAIQQLKNNPDASVESLFAGDSGANNHVEADQSGIPANSVMQNLPGQPDMPGLSILTDLIQICYPDMPRVAAQALAESASMKNILVAMGVHKAILDQTMSDFVVVVYFALLRRSVTEMDRLIAENVVFQRAVAKLSL